VNKEISEIQINYWLQIAFATGFILNLVTWTYAEYVFVATSLVMVGFAGLKKYGYSWDNLLPKTGYDWIWAAWLGWMLLGYIVNGKLGAVQLDEIFRFRWILLSYFIARSFKGAEPKIPYIHSVFIIISVMSLYWIIDYFTNSRAREIGWGFPNRLAGPYSNTNDYAHSYGLIFTMGLGILVFSNFNRVREKLFFLINLCLVGVSVFLTFNRSILIAILFSIFTSGVLISWRKFLLPFIAIVLVLGTAYKLDLGKFQQRTEMALNASQNSDNIRLVLWKANILMFKENPVFGMGHYENVRNIRQVYDKMNIVPGYFEGHAHNQLLNHLAGVGLVGTFIFYGIILLGFWYCYRNIKLEAPGSTSQIILVSVFLGLLAFTFAGVADVNLSMTATRYILVFLIAFIISYKAYRKEAS